MAEEGTRRPLHSDLIDGSNIPFSISSGFPFGQLALRLKTDNLPEDEQIVVLQQMLFLSLRSDEDLRVALDSEGIESASSLFTKTPNKRIKQLCIGLVGMIGQLGVEDEQKEDLIDLCIPLSKLLFSSDNELQRRGKNTLMNLVERNEEVVSNLLQIGILDRAAESLMRIPLSSSQQQTSILSMASSQSQTSSSSPYSIFVMNILEVLNKVLNCENAMFSKSNKLISALERIKNEGNTKEIRKKARNVQDSIIDEGQDNETETQLEQSKEKIISLEDRIRILEESIRNKEERERIQQQENIKSDQQIDTLKKDKNEAMRISSQISKRMNDHLKSMVNESDLEKLRMIPWIEMCKDLSKPKVSGQEGSIDSQRQIEICEYLIELFKDSKINDEYRNRFIQCGAAKALLNIFQNWKLEDIKEQYSEAFFLLAYTSNEEIIQLIFTLNPFKGLLNLLEHSNIIIQKRGLESIFNIQLGGSRSKSKTEVHPYFDAIASIGGIEKIYEFMNRNNTTKYCKDLSAITIGYFYRARNYENVDMRINVIKQLKSVVQDQNNSLKVNAKSALNKLTFNSDNKEEIEKGGFVVPE
ncbi:MAG: hypothetical protein EZS28_002135 [Streblomastix strix]|uniref:Uncharacterized protein n=1 Tax=Streblomastix strix TaxID=222440 RepID=A0A5J4X559_9EUKA|nr:MAG: hypothetical protein EZS28_002135 [Streblomastix strix]